ncbi:Cap15 family cyclic dinucleotide receptor domain-containing protein [Caproiciproducens sp.]|jgi:hypothetical protein
MTENDRKFVNISIWLTAILLLVRLLISWTDVKDMWEAGHIFSLCYSFFGFIGEAIGVTAIVMAVFNKRAWKWKWLRWTHDIPVLAKSYNGEFISDYDGIKRLGTMIIDQTFLSVAVQLKTDESSSRSLAASFSDVQSVRYLIYTYQNDPHAEIQDRSPMHYGTAILNVSNPMILEGNYFTGRKSRGSMKFEAEK